MRTKTVALLSLLSLAVLAACSASQDDADSAESAQTDDDIARGALRTLGAKLPNEERSNATCQNCHDPNKLTLKKWAESFNTKLGILTAGTHFTASATVDPTRHPLTYKYTQVLRPRRC